MQTRPLKRSVSLIMLTLYGLGTTVGAGIYVLVGKVAGASGVFAPLAFLVAALVAGITALSFGQLVARFPRSAGEAIYVKQAFQRPWVSFVVGLMVVFVGLVSSATIINGVIGYAQNLVSLPAWLLMLLIIGLLVSIAAWGISESVMVAGIITVLEVGGLLVIVWYGRGSLDIDAYRAAVAAAPPWSAVGWHGVAVGAVLAFYAFIGFEDMVNLAEETRDAPRTVPRAILLTLVLTTGLYVLVSVVSIAAMPLSELAASAAPLSDLFTRLSGVPATAIDGLAVVAVLNGALIQIIMASRVLYGMAREDWLPAIFGSLNMATRTPVFSTLIAGIVVAIFAFTLPLVTLAEITSLFTLIIFALINFALLAIRRREAIESSESAPIPPLPLLGMVSCTGLAAFQLWEFALRFGN